MPNKYPVYSCNPNENINEVVFDKVVLLNGTEAELDAKNGGIDPMDVGEIAVNTTRKEINHLFGTNDLRRIPFPAPTECRNATAVDFQMGRACDAQSASGTYSVISGGKNNTVSGCYSTISGGCGNTASGNCSTISGGYGNTVSDCITTVSGGAANISNGYFSTVGGGACNISSGFGGGIYVNSLGGTTVSGGYRNTACRSFSTASGGYLNTVSGNYSTIAGGICNNIPSSYWSAIGGGQCNCVVYGDHSVISGGGNNTAQGGSVVIAGGRLNCSCAANSTILGGSSNANFGRSSNIVGGVCNINTSTGICSTIAGGTRNTINSPFSFIAGGSANNTRGFANTFILGTSLSANQANYTYVNNLSSQGIVNANGGNSDNWNLGFNAGTIFSQNSASYANTIGFFDDFGDSLYYPVSSTIIHNVSTARITQTKDPYYIALLNTPPPRVTFGGGLTSVNTPLYYLGSTVPSTSGNMSLGFTFQLDRTNITGVGANIFNISFSNNQMILGNPGSINPTGVVHINFTRLGVSTIDYFNTGIQLSCVNAFYDGAQYPFGPTQMRLDAEYAILLKVSGNYLTITVPGMGSLVFYEKDLSTKVGTSKTYFWWECGNGNFFGISPRLYKIWGGPSPQMLDSDPSCGGFVGGNIPFLHGSGPIQLPATIQSYGATNWAPTQVQNQNAIPAGAYGLVVAGNGTTGANGYTTGGNSYFEGLVLANLGNTPIGGSTIGYGTFEIPSGVNAPTSTVTTGAETALIGIPRLQNVQAGDRQTIEIIGTILGGTNTISVRVFATNETAITYTGSATGTFRIIINRKTTTTNTDQVYAEFWIGTSLIATNRTAFNNTNWFPYQFRVTQSIASQVIVDDIRNTVQKVNIR